MTIHRRLNQTGFGGNFTMWWLKETLKDAGWTVESSGSGVGGVYSSSGEVFDTGGKNPVKGTDAVDIGVGVGDEHFGNSKCWFRMADPDGNREILIVRTTNFGNGYDGWWWMGYSRAAGFTGGTPDEDTPPDATDEVSISSSGSKSAPGSMLSSGNIGTMLQVAADDEPSPAGEYGFILLDLLTPNNLKAWIMLDDLRQTATGEPSPLAIGFVSGSLSTGSLCGADIMGWTWVDVGGGAESCKRISYGVPYPSTYYPVVARTNKYDGKERAVPLVAVEPDVGGYMGVSRWLMSPAVSRDYPNTGDSLTYLFFDDALIVDLWDGATTPLGI